MKKNIFFLLLITTLAVAAEPLKGKRLANLSIEEIEKIFNAENERFKEEKVAELAEEMSENFNGSMIIARGGKMITKTNYGFIHLYKGCSNSMREKDENAITSSTFFELASISKQFTAVAALTLIEDGKLRFDDSLQKFFPALPYRGITIRHMLTHTSGLPDYIDYPDNSVNDSEQPIGNEEMAELFVKMNERAKFAPGTKFEYTNTNYMLLAIIIEKVSGKKFENYVRERVFTPASMTNSFYVSEADRKSKNVIAFGHLRNGQELKPHFTDGTIGDKGLYSTAEELFLWKKAFFDEHKILSDSMRRLATSIQNIVKGKQQPEEKYGFGFRIEENSHYGKLIYHGGLWHGFQNLFLYREKDDLVLIFLTNWRNSAHLGKSGAIMHILDGA